jgi:hypothetical protein
MHQAVMNIEPITDRSSAAADQVTNGADLVGVEREDARVTTDQFQATKRHNKGPSRTVNNNGLSVIPTYQRLTNGKLERYIFYNHCHISKKGNPGRVPN